MSNVDYVREFHPLANHLTMLNNFTKGKIHEFSVLPFSLKFDQILSNLIVCLMISQNLHSKVAQNIQHIAMDTK